MIATKALLELNGYDRVFERSLWAKGIWISIKNRYDHALGEGHPSPRDMQHTANNAARLRPLPQAA
jgi:hypothetical protein